MKCGTMALMVLMGLFVVDSALARERSATVTGSGGRSGTRSVEAGMTENGYNRTVTNQGPYRSGGHSTTYTSNGNGSVSGTTTVQGPGGGSTSYSSSTQSHTAANGGRGHSTTVTGPGGNTANRDVEAGMTEEGYQRNVTATGPAGRSGSRTSTFKRQ
jgi:hypothetical protein